MKKMLIYKWIFFSFFWVSVYQGWNPPCMFLTVKICSMSTILKKDVEERCWEMWKGFQRIRATQWAFGRDAAGNGRPGDPEQQQLRFEPSRRFGERGWVRLWRCLVTGDGRTLKCKLKKHLTDLAREHRTYWPKGTCQDFQHCTESSWEQIDTQGYDSEK